MAGGLGLVAGMAIWEVGIGMGKSLACGAPALRCLRLFASLTFCFVREAASCL